MKRTMYRRGVSHLFIIAILIGGSDSYLIGNNEVFYLEWTCTVLLRIIKCVSYNYFVIIIVLYIIKLYKLNHIFFIAVEWASSGARLGLKLDLQFYNGCTEYNQEALFGGGGVLPPSLLSAVPLNEPSFTGKHGIETVKVTQGALSIQEQNADKCIVLGSVLIL